MECNHRLSAADGGFAVLVLRELFRCAESLLRNRLSLQVGSVPKTGSPELQSGADCTGRALAAADNAL